MPDDGAERYGSDAHDRLLARIDALLRESEKRTLQALRSTAAATERSGRTEANRVFAQVEALLWLRDALRLEHPLPPTRGWAASPDLLLEVVRYIEEHRPGIVVELGSGVSSIVIAASLRRWGPGRLVSIDHDETYATRTRLELSRQGLSSTAVVLQAPLGDVIIQGQAWPWYELEENAVPNGIALLFVDGPPGPTGRLARYPALPVLFDRLGGSAAVILDDGARPDEREVVDRWQREFPAFEAVELPVEKGAWLLTRVP